MVTFGTFRRWATLLLVAFGPVQHKVDSLRYRRTTSANLQQ